MVVQGLASARNSSVRNSSIELPFRPKIFVEDDRPMPIKPLDTSALTAMPEYVPPVVQPSDSDKQWRVHVRWKGLMETPSKRCNYLLPPVPSPAMSFSDMETMYPPSPAGSFIHRRRQGEYAKRPLIETNENGGKPPVQPQSDANARGGDVVQVLAVSYGKSAVVKALDRWNNDYVAQAAATLSEEPVTVRVLGLPCEASKGRRVLTDTDQSGGRVKSPMASPSSLSQASLEQWLAATTAEDPSGRLAANGSTHDVGLEQPSDHGKASSEDLGLGSDLVQPTQTPQSQINQTNPLGASLTEVPSGEDAFPTLRVRNPDVLGADDSLDQGSEDNTKPSGSTTLAESFEPLLARAATQAVIPPERWYGSMRNTPAIRAYDDRGQQLRASDGLKQPFRSIKKHGKRLWERTRHFRKSDDLEHLRGGYGRSPQSTSIETETQPRRSNETCATSIERMSTREVDLTSLVDDCKHMD